MSTHINVKRKCYICNKESNFVVLGSTNTFGSPDLDLRPAEMMRSTMFWWIQECPNCGYVSRSVSDRKGVSKEWLASEEFNQYKSLNFISKLAEKFYKAYLISAKLNNDSQMYYNALHAAWACDDSDDINNAVICRKLALKAIDKIIPYEKDDFKLIKADLLRRSGQFDLLIEEFSNVKFEEDILNQVIKFQLKKAQEKDSDCYRVSDAVEKD